MKISAENIIPPSWLNETGKKVFKVVADLLKDVEIITDADVNHLALYCEYYSLFLSFKRQVKTKGMWVDGKPNPFLAKMDKAADKMRAFASDLGLTPAARARLAITLSDNEDEDDGEW
jgi:P27 family predicted phage terminase small subunit